MTIIYVYAIVLYIDENQCEVTKMDVLDVAAICKALGDSNRLQIIQMLSDGEKCGCKLLEAFEITQPTLSHHMKILCDSGVVIGRKEGKWTHYSISSEGAEYAAQCLQALTTIDTICEEKLCCED